MGILGATWRPLAQFMPHNRLGVRVYRNLFAVGLAIGSPAVKSAQFDRVERPTDSGLILRGEWVRTPATRRTDGVILYAHGSGYMVCSSRTHRGLTSHLSAETGLPVFSIDYRLAPTHQYPAASDDLREAWEWLVAQGYAPDRIVVAGDSAGGHLAVALGLKLAREDAPLPAAIVTLSPVLDLSVSAGLTRDRIERDPFVSAQVASRTLKRYADKTAQEHEGLRIAFDDLAQFPPMLAHCGSREMLAADCTELARLLSAAGFAVDHRVWPGQMHVFQALTAVVPESRPALAAIGTFVAAHLPPALAVAPEAMSA